jgi:omega-3 fatty acid desaturase (delta-15 desaturase)
MLKVTDAMSVSGRFKDDAIHPFFPSATEIKRVIPESCFRSDLTLSLWYAIRILILSVILGVILAFSRFFTTSLTISALYAYLQGLIFWGFFTIGHDCGHGAFSRYPKINWLVGNFFHSLILTPYEPWRLSHRSHHKNTCNMQKEEIFYPNPPRMHAPLTLGVGTAWFFYIIFSNVPGRRKYLAYFSREFSNCGISLFFSFASIAFVIWSIVKAVSVFGLHLVILYYGAPVFVFACWLVIVTFLHHNDENCPWYIDEEWTHVKGSVSSIDRDYGFLVNNLSHNINLHQIHHLFPKIPHYHLHEATLAFRKAFPALVRTKGGSNLVAFARGLYNWATTNAVADDTGLFIYKQNSA